MTVLESFQKSVFGAFFQRSQQSVSSDKSEINTSFFLDCIVFQEYGWGIVKEHD